MEYHNQRWKTSIRGSLYFMILLGSVMSCIGLKAQAPKKVKVFLMAGQSNMQGHGDKKLDKILCAMGHLDDPDDPDGCFQSISSEEDRIHAAMVAITGGESEGNRIIARALSQNELIDDRLYHPSEQVSVISFSYPNRNDEGVRGTPRVWSGPLKIGFGHSNNNVSFGPELVFGHRMATEVDEDIVLIKVAEGGSDLHEMWRSPSMEARLGPGAKTSNYPLLKQHLQEVLSDLGSYLPKYQGVAVETEVTGFVWFQGFNDAVNSTFAEAYELNFQDFLSDLRNDLELPEIPIVIGQTNNSGTSGLMVQAAQQTIADRIGNTETLTTRELSGFYHFNPGAYLVIGDRMGRKMLELIRTVNNSTTPAAPTELAAVSSSNAVVLSWADAASNETGFRIERSLSASAGFTEVALLLPNTRSYVDTGLSRDTYFYRVSSFNDSGRSPYASISFDLDKYVLPPWFNMDIGEPVVGGSANEENGIFTLEGGGKEIHGNSDEFHYLYQKVTGDYELTAKVNSLTGGAEAALAGIMFRSLLSHNSAHGTVGFNNKGQIKWESRGGNGSGTFQQQQPTTAQWIKLVKAGQMLSAYASENGTSWELFYERAIDIGENYNVGLLANSGDTNALATAVFSEVSLTGQGVVLPQPPSELNVSVNSSESISLQWTGDASNHDGFRLERSLSRDTGFEIVATLSAGATNYEDTGLLPMTTYHYRLSAYNSVGAAPFLMTSATTEAASNDVPAPWMSENIGDLSSLGSATYTDGTFTLSGSGQALTGKSDQFYFVQQPMTGDVVFTAKVDQSNTTAAIAGIMIRGELNDHSPHATIALTPEANGLYRSRGHTGGATYKQTADATGNSWIRLVKVGNIISGYLSADGENWQLVRAQNIKTGNDYYLGMMVTSGDLAISSTGVFSDVTMVGDQAGRLSHASAKEAVVPSMAKAHFTVYPSLTNGNFTIDLGEGVDDQPDVHLLSLQGREIPIRMIRNGNELKISFQGAPGTYFLRITDGSGQQKSLLIKQE